jgi:hypothetical protein
MTAWASLYNYLDWALLNGEVQDQHIALGTAYIGNQQIYPYDGAKSFFGNVLPYPRTGATRWHNGGDVPPASVPIEVKIASMTAALISASPKGLPTANVFGGIETKRERVEGAVTIEYFHSSEGQTSNGASLIGSNIMGRYGHPDVTGILMPLLDQEALDDAFNPNGVSRAQASKRGVYSNPANPVPIFTKGMADASRQAEDVAYSSRSFPTG